MDRSAIEAVFEKCFKKLNQPRSKPEEKDWERLSARFQTSWPNDFICFMELCCEYDVDWQFLTVNQQMNSSADTIEGVYDHEMKSGQWDQKFIPFHDVGSGDYYCLNSSESDDSVYYFDHSVPEYRKSDNSIGEWIVVLPEVFG